MTAAIWPAELIWNGEPLPTENKLLGDTVPTPTLLPIVSANRVFVPSVVLPVTPSEELSTVAPVTFKVEDKVAAPVTPKVDWSEVAPLAVKLPLTVAAPATAKLFPKVAAPTACNVPFTSKV